MKMKYTAFILSMIGAAAMPVGYGCSGNSENNGSGGDCTAFDDPANAYCTGIVTLPVDDAGKPTVTCTLCGQDVGPKQYLPPGRANLTCETVDGARCAPLSIDLTCDASVPVVCTPTAQ